jgi:hypothetical protein
MHNGLGPVRVSPRGWDDRFDEEEIYRAAPVRLCFGVIFDRLLRTTTRWRSRGQFFAAIRPASDRLYNAVLPLRAPERSCDGHIQISFLIGTGDSSARIERTNIVKVRVRQFWNMQRHNRRCSVLGRKIVQ